MGAILGEKRLIDERRPATMRLTAGDSVPLATLEAGSKFVTALDAIDLGSRTRDELWPHLNAVLEVLRRIPTLGEDSEPIAKTRVWCNTLASLPLSATLDEDQARNLRFELHVAYESLKALLNVSAR